MTVLIDHVVIAVSDWAVSNAFYRDVVGAEIVPRGDGYAYRFGRQQLNAHGPGMSPGLVATHRVVPGNSDLCLVWPGTPEEAVAQLERHGVAVVAGPGPREGGRGTGVSIYFRDPDGSLLEFICYPPAG